MAGTARDVTEILLTQDSYEKLGDEGSIIIRHKNDERQVRLIVDDDLQPVGESDAEPPPEGEPSAFH